jgi:CRISPR-associated endonuclease/helicase Cas3
VLCISTQVIEAGVDISFQQVVRLTAGMDSIIQSAGRCNRNGESAGLSPVYIVDCQNEKLSKLEDIRRGKTATSALIEDYCNRPETFNSDLSSDQAVSRYYSYLYQDLPKELQNYPVEKLNSNLFDLLSTNHAFADDRCSNVEEYFLWQAFQSAGSLFKVFDEETTDAIVPYKEGKIIISELCSSRCEFDKQYKIELLKKAAPFCVSLYDYQKQSLFKNDALYTSDDGSVLILDENYYDSELGLLTEKKEMPFLEV